MDKNEIIESLSQHEKLVLPHINKKTSMEEAAEKTRLDSISIFRALQYLENKKLVHIEKSKNNIISLGKNGIRYLKEGLPERQLLSVFVKKDSIGMNEIGKETGLDKDEIKAAIGVLKKKAFVEIINGRLTLAGKKSDMSRKMLEETFLEKLPMEYSGLAPEQLYAYQNLKSRKDIIEEKEKTIVKVSITELGDNIKSLLKNFNSELIEHLTSDIIKNGDFKEKKFRRYDLTSPVPQITGGRRQPYYYFLQDVRKKLVAMGFMEMTGNTIVSEFWNFDSLFQPQFHSARDWSDNYQAKEKKLPLPDKKLVEAVKQVHERKWKYEWSEEKAKNAILRPQATVISAQTLAKEKKGKFFALARVYRPDIVDAKHLSEFNQLEGIIIDKNLSFANLLYVLNEFAKTIANAVKENIRFRPSYFPFTEPSVEIDIRHEKLGWLEIGGAGIFRKEVTEPLTGMKDSSVRVLAWGLGIDRLAMLKLGIADIRELFSQNLEFLRGKGG